MHDIDRTQSEFSQETGFEAEQFVYGESSWAGEGGVLSEADEMQLASELLGVSTEAELDQFLGSLIKTASSAIGSGVRSPIGCVGKSEGLSREGQNDITPPNEEPGDRRGRGRMLTQVCDARKR